jgi:hypothetical protein
VIVVRIAVYVVYIQGILCSRTILCSRITCGRRILCSRGDVTDQDGSGTTERSTVRDNKRQAGKRWGRHVEPFRLRPRPQADRAWPPCRRRSRPAKRVPFRRRASAERAALRQTLCVAICRRCGERPQRGEQPAVRKGGVTSTWSPKGDRAWCYVGVGVSGRGLLCGEARSALRATLVLEGWCPRVCPGQRMETVGDFLMKT